jgi:hypothetical protein
MEETTIRRFTYREEDNIKIDPKNSDRLQWRILFNTVMDRRVS